MANYTQPEFNLSVAEADLPTYMRVYRTLKGTFTTDTRMVILNVEGDLYEFRLIGLTSRDTLEFCANVFAELPTETVNLVEEAQEYSLSDPEGTGEEEEEDVLEGESDDEGDEEEEEFEEEDSINSNGETPSEEVERKLKKAKLVRRTGSSAVTVESD